jgi:hypothetical protein
LAGLSRFSSSQSLPASSVLEGSRSSRQRWQKLYFSSLKRSEYTEWTLFEVGDKRFPQYMRLSSVDPFNNMVSVQWNFLVDPSSPLTGENQHKIDGGVYTEDVTVVDCKESQFVLAERTVVNQSNEAIYHYKWSDPHFSDFSIGARFIPGSVMFGAQNILCHEELRTPLLQKADLALTKFKSLASFCREIGGF